MRPFSPEARVQALLDVEVALVAAAADAGIVSATCVSDIRDAAHVERFDVAALEAEAVQSGNIVIPLVQHLRAVVASQRAESARWVHYGATSQDILDTALVLQLRACTPVLRELFAKSMSSAAAAARMYATTPMPGRTWLQHASPITFGLKAAGWLDLLGRARERLSDALERLLVVQFGGASGTLASLGDRGPQVLDAFARRLSLNVPDTPWHTQRDRLVDVAAALGIACGSLGKIGRDVVLLGQSEVSEVIVKAVPGQGTSSAMPHKQNPVRAVTAVAASIRAPGLVATMLTAMPQEHERAAGGWQAEWVTMPELAELTCDAAEAIADVLSHLNVDPTRMRHNLERDGGIAMSEALAAALSDHVPRPDAQEIVERLCRVARHDERTLKQVASESAEITQWFSAAQIEAILTAGTYLGSAGLFIERALRRWGV